MSSGADSLPLTVSRVGKDWVTEFVDRDHTILAKGLRLRDERDGAWSTVAVPVSPVWHLLGTIGLSRRLLRLGVHGVGVIRRSEPHDVVLIAMGAFWLWRRGEKPTRLHRFQRGRRPLRSGWLIDGRGRIVYGEYWANPAREAVRIWCSDASLRNWSVLGEIPAGSARHIHCLLDEGEGEGQGEGGVGGGLLVATGDADEESAVWRLQDGRLTRLEGGSQRWRLVSALRSGGDFLYATDTPGEQNHLYRSPLDGSGTRSEVAEIDGPVYYSVRWRDTNVFATTVERGPGEWDDCVRIWTVGDGPATSRSIARKDRWSNRLFGHGVAHFPRGNPSELDALPVAVDAAVPT